MGYRGGWVLVDNGYLPWPSLVPPSKMSLSYSEMRFSRWVESLRKDVECTFGIMKGRFRILKTGIPLHGIEVTDRVWLTCCALHNFLLEEDNLNSQWDASKYLSVEGRHDEEDVRHFLAATTFPEVAAGSTFDMSGMGGGDQHGDAPELDGIDEEMADASDDAIPVHRMELSEFKHRLIENFDILWEKRQVRWP